MLSHDTGLTFSCPRSVFACTRARRQRQRSCSCTHSRGADSNVPCAHTSDVCFMSKVDLDARDNVGI